MQDGFEVLKVNASLDRRAELDKKALKDAKKSTPKRPGGRRGRRR